MTVGELELNFNILGPLEAMSGGRRIPVGGSRQRVVLAMLLLTPGRVVSIDRLRDAVWGGRAPTTSRTQIAICVAALRKAFKTAGHANQIIETASPGYMIVDEGHRIDAVTFASQVAEAKVMVQRGQTAGGASLLSEALGLWRGLALADINGLTVEAESARLEEKRFEAYELWAHLQLDLGQHREVVAELAGVVDQQPLRDQIRATLMLAHYRSGQRSESLKLFREARKLSIDELGLEPSRVLQDLHSAILREEPALMPAIAAAGPVEQLPARLPPEVPAFSGRGPELSQLDGLLDGQPAGASAAFGVIEGRTGVGKTALAVCWARRVADAFPDGQLFADLRGSDASAPVPADVVLPAFLRSLGVAEAELPSGLEDQASLFQRCLDGRRVLVILDNVEDSLQIQLLIPRSSTCCVLATSRRSFGGGPTVRCRLAPLDRAQSVAMLATSVGDGRVREDLNGTEQVVELCDRLPSALVAAAERLVAKPHWTVRHLLARLRDPLHRLDELSHGQKGVRVAFERSYRDLNPGAALMYHRLGLLPEARFAAASGAHLLDTSPLDAENLIEQLVDGALVAVVGRETDGQLRYELPGLLRLHARECAQVSESPAESAAAAARLTAWLDDDGTCAGGDQCPSCRLGGGVRVADHCRTCD